MKDVNRNVNNSVLSYLRIINTGHIKFYEARHFCRCFGVYKQKAKMTDQTKFSHMDWEFSDMRPGIYWHRSVSGECDSSPKLDLRIYFESFIHITVDNSLDELKTYNEKASYCNAAFIGSR